MARLNSGGFPSNRNLARGYRPIRVVEKNGRIIPDPLDMMRASAFLETDGPNKGLPKRVNTTGCVGTPSSFGVRVYIPGPKTGRIRNKKRKRVCKLYNGDSEFDFKKGSIKQIKSLRGDLLTVNCIKQAYGIRLDENIGHLISRMTNYLMSNMPKEDVLKMWQSDEGRELSMKGLVKSKGFKFGQIRKYQQRIDQAKFLLTHGG